MDDDLQTILVLVAAIACGLAGVFLTHRTVVKLASRNAPEPTRDVSKRCPGCDAPEELDMEFCPVCGRRYDRS